MGDKHLSEKPPRLLRRKADKTPVVAAFVPKGADVPRPDEVETVPGPGLKKTVSGDRISTAGRESPA